MITLIVLTAISCNKNQKAVRQLDGEWKATKLISTDEPLINYAALIDVRLTFDNCKLADNEYCSMSSSTTFGSETETTNGLFKVTEDGTTMEFLIDGGTEIITITDLSNSELKMTRDDSTWELEKQ